MNEKQCSLCGIVEADDISLPWFPGHTCSPECARTKAIVDAIKGIGMLTLDAKVLAMLNALPEEVLEDGKVVRIPLKPQ